MTNHRKKAENGGGGVYRVAGRLLCIDFSVCVLCILFLCVCLCSWVIPELIGQTLTTVMMMVSMHWFILILNLPVAAWDLYRYVKVPLGNMGVFDPTEIHNRGQLKSHMKEAMIKLGFHLLCFFIYLYSMILALIND
uniref:Cornichon family member 4 n=1 Tax=Gadus morhua TaxID=8049 RepID=A0A8C5C5B6_GADMO